MKYSYLVVCARVTAVLHLVVTVSGLSVHKFWSLQQLVQRRPQLCFYSPADVNIKLLSCVLQCSSLDALFNIFMTFSIKVLHALFSYANWSQFVVSTLNGGNNLVIILSVKKILMPNTNGLLHTPPNNDRCFQQTCFGILLVEQNTLMIIVIDRMTLYPTTKGFGSSTPTVTSFLEQSNKAFKAFKAKSFFPT